MTAISLRAIDRNNFRACLDIRHAEGQEKFVATTAEYLVLCHYGEQGWSPLGIYYNDEMVGFAMWAVDPADGSHWIGGLIIDHRHQRRGIGRAAMEELIRRLSAKPNCKQVALSYRKDNHAARSLYARLGFSETGEVEDDEIVARLNVS